MEQRLSLITLGVKDLEQSRRFYEDGLGWKRSTNDEGIVFFQINGSAFALFPQEELAADAQVDDDGSGFRRFTMAYCTRTRDEVDAVLKEAERAGARILKPADNTFWGGYSGYFADPDGFAWEVAWNPAWGMTPEGDIILNPQQ